MSLIGNSVSTSVPSASEEGFHPPGPGDFNLPPVGPDDTFEFLGQTMYAGITKPMLQLVLAAVLVFWFLYAAARREAMVPGKLQYAGEQAYGFVRNSIARDISLGAIYRGVGPFIAADIVRLTILCAFPVIATILPRTME